MQSLLRSLTAAQRSELNSLVDGLLRDDRLRWDLAQLAATLDQLLPEGLGDRFRFSGDEELGLEGALGQLETLGRLEALEARLDDVGTPGDLAGIDRDDLRELAGEDAVRDLDRLDEIAARLEAAGYLTRTGEQLELTPRGSRRIGQKVLNDLFARLRRDAFGEHRVDRAGRGSERSEGTKPFEFGDPFDLDLRETLANALTRPENAPSADRGRGIRLVADDFAVHRTEESTRTATVLLVDMSRSMLLRGCFVAAKKVAVALDTLIRTQYPRDDLTVIGFAYYAREIRPGTLAELSWHGYEYGTNLQHGLLLARRILARSGAANRQIVVITDGEPTAHFENGQVEFNYPPTRQTIQATLREVQRCTKAGITINTFMLERVPGADRVRGPHHPAQPRPGILRRAGAPGRIRPGRFRPRPDRAPPGLSPHRIAIQSTNTIKRRVQMPSVAASVAELLGLIAPRPPSATAGCVIADEAAFRATTIRDLAWTAAFSSDEPTVEAARWLVWEASLELGAHSASIQDLYLARSRGEVHGFTVPAINLRAQTFDMARTIFQTAAAGGVGAVILELARSEQTYTYQRPAEYATSVLAGAIAANWQHPVFIQGDHYQFNAAKYTGRPGEDDRGDPGAPAARRSRSATATSTSTARPSSTSASPTSTPSSARTMSEPPS